MWRCSSSETLRMPPRKPGSPSGSSGKRSIMCWPDWASPASMTRGYSVTALAGWTGGPAGKRLIYVVAGRPSPRLDDEVIQRHRPGELDGGAVPAQLLGHLVEPAEDLPVPPAELAERGAQDAARGPVADAHDL